MANKGDPSASTGMIMARPLYRKNPPPNYPRRARRKGYEGNVILEVLVDEQGNVMELKLFKSSGYKSLDQSALSSVRKWLFQPGTRNGKAAQMWVRVPIRFKLN
jgi:protein TonB